MIEHLDEPARAVSEAVRVAHRAVVVSTPYKTVLNGEPEHVWAYDLDSMCDMLSVHGRVRLVMCAYDYAKHRTPLGWQIMVASVTKDQS